MGNTKRGLRALGLSLLAATGLMVFMAAGASAASFDVNGTSGLHATATGQLKEEGLLKVEAQNLIIHCATATVTNGLIYADGTKAHATINYSKCKTLVKNIENPGCVPTIDPVNVKILPITHSSKSYLLVEPLTGTQFTQIHYNEETCGLPVLPAVTGTVVFECEDGSLKEESCSTLKVTRLIKPASLTLFSSDTLKYGLNAATLEKGEAEISLTGDHTGQTLEALI